MAMKQTTPPVDDDKMNAKFKSLLDEQIDSADANGTPVNEIPHKAPAGSNSSDGPMGGNLMSFTQMLESLDDINTALTQQNTDISNAMASDEPTGAADDKDLLEELNKLFTPVLVMQNLEAGISDQANQELSEASVLTERSVIQFDDAARMAQLIATCALLIAKKKNSENWNVYKNAAAVKNQAKLNIQKEEYADAAALAQKYLVMVSTTNNSSVARDAANELLPQTQH